MLFLSVHYTITQRCLEKIKSVIYYGLHRIYNSWSYVNNSYNLSYIKSYYLANSIFTIWSYVSSATTIKKLSSQQDWYLSHNPFFSSDIYKLNLSINTLIFISIHLQSISSISVICLCCRWSSYTKYSAWNGCNRW